MNLPNKVLKDSIFHGEERGRGFNFPRSIYLSIYVVFKTLSLYHVPSWPIRASDSVKGSMSPPPQHLQHN